MKAEAAEQSPSSGLLLFRAEHSAGPADETVHRGGFLDVLVRAAEDLGQRRLDVGQKNLAAWDASAAVRRDASVDGCRELRLPDVDVGKLVDREQADLELDARTSDVWADRAAVP
jgi:hypothetical protein